jgi:hypothetical protein
VESAHFNTPLAVIPDSGQIAEVTVLSHSLIGILEVKAGRRFIDSILAQRIGSLAWQKGPMENRGMA